MKKIILTRVASIIFITGGIVAYDLTDREEMLIDKIVVLFEKESPTQQQKLITRLQHAQGKTQEERKAAIIDAVLNALDDDQTDTDDQKDDHYESDQDFDLIYDEFLEQMREGNVHSHMLTIIDDMLQTPAQIIMDIEADVKYDDMERGFAGKISLYIDPTDNQSAGSITIEGSDGVQEGSVYLEFKSNRDDVYVKINDVVAPDDTLPADVAMGLQLLQGQRLQIPLEAGEGFTMTDWSDLENTIDIGGEIKVVENLLTNDDVRTYDTTREAREDYIPIVATETYQDDIEAGEEYSFIKDDDQWILQSVNGDQTYAIGSDTVYIKEHNESMTYQTTITTSQSRSMKMMMKMQDQYMDMEITMEYYPTDTQKISYPSDVVNMSEMMQSME